MSIQTFLYISQSKHFFTKLLLSILVLFHVFILLASDFFAVKFSFFFSTLYSGADLFLNCSSFHILFRDDFFLGF